MQGGGRALENNYKFPTQTVNNLNQLNIEGVSKVRGAVKKTYILSGHVRSGF